MKFHATAFTAGLLLATATIAGCVPCPNGPCVTRTSEVPAITPAEPPGQETFVPLIIEPTSLTWP